jgi:hypothetical protein
LLFSLSFFLFSFTLFFIPSFSLCSYLLDTSLFYYLNLKSSYFDNLCRSALVEAGSIQEPEASWIFSKDFKAIMGNQLTELRGNHGNHV